MSWSSSYHDTKSLNGQNLLQAVKANLTSGVLTRATDKTLTLSFDAPNDAIDEDSACSIF